MQSLMAKSGYDHIARVLAQTDTILFIGSGISIWSGLPTWSGMIEELAQFVEKSGANADLIRGEAAKGDLLQAASYGFDKLTKQQIGEFVRDSCRYGKAKPQQIHEKIVSLGPRCFVTTNYDDLIEQSLRLWQPDRFYRPPITNRQLTETATIVHAQAVDFIFKPHGDAADSESIILTREQYRQLLPQGERQGALESVKMLLASRPVVYLGFGLRDPDFIYVRDLLMNTYKGATRAHYAIMADVEEPEIDYWRRNYGIHLINYATTLHPDKTRDHSLLLKLLDTLVEKRKALEQKSHFDATSSDVRLALARHAAALERTPKLTPEFPIRVRYEDGNKNRVRDSVRKFDYFPVEKFLATGPESAILVGLPGAGKSYSLRQAAAQLANRLYEACILEVFDQSQIVIPLLVDMKLYVGDLEKLIAETLPSSLPLDELFRCFKVKVFVDSFNEMPREYWESGIYESDFQQFAKKLGQGSLIVGSRTSDGLSKLELPVFSLDEIDKNWIEDEVRRLGLNINGRFSAEIFWLLQRPFYFQYIASGAIALPADAQPRDFYKCLFENSSKAFEERFQQPLEIETILAGTAYESLNRGEEAFPISYLLNDLESRSNADMQSVSPPEIINWLVSHSILIPYSGNRIAFVHQSVTEYLAATELATRYMADPRTLKEKLALTRWDQALFVTLSLLPSDKAENFLQDVIKADFSLALNAAKYLESGRNNIIRILLSGVPERKDNDYQFNSRLASAITSGLPLTEEHEPQLRAIIQCGNSLGGAAVERLVLMKGEEVKEEIMHLLYSRHDDFNLCLNSVGPALRPFATENDASVIAAWADQLEAEISLGSMEDDVEGFTSGSAALLGDLDLSIVWREFVGDWKGALPKLRATILCTILQDRDTSESLTLAGELLLNGVDKAAISIYFISNFSKQKNELSWKAFSNLHVSRLVDILIDSGESWSLEALKAICSARPDLAELLMQDILTSSGFKKAILLYCVSPANLAPIFQELEKLIGSSELDREQLSFEWLRRIDFDWSGREQLFIDLLKLRDIKLVISLGGGSLPPKLPNLGILSIGEIDWWLDWMFEAAKLGDGDWFGRTLGGIFARHLSSTKQAELIAEFNNDSSKFRRILLDKVIPYLDTSTDMFNNDTISFLLADLSRPGAVSPWHAHLLGSTATERFVNDRLLPLLPGAQFPLMANLESVLQQAGTRHGRRYVVGLCADSATM